MEGALKSRKEMFGVVNAPCESFADGGVQAVSVATTASHAAQ